MKSHKHIDPVINPQDSLDDVALSPLRSRFFRSRAGKTPTRGQDKAPNLGNMSVTGGPKTLDGTSGHEDPDGDETHTIIESDISHQPGRKKDQHMVSRVSLSRRDAMEASLKNHKTIQERKNPVAKKSPQEEIAWKVLRHWNGQDILRTHRTTAPLSKTVKQSLKLVEDALKGNLHVDHDQSLPGRKFNYQNFVTAIARLVGAATDPACGRKTNDWAKSLSLRNFLLNQTPLTMRDQDSSWALRNLSPFLFFVDNFMEDQKLVSKKLKFPVEELKKAHSIIAGFFSNPFPFTKDVHNSLSKFIEYIDDFLAENDYGFDAKYSRWAIFRMFCTFAFDGKDFQKIDMLFYPSIRREFFEHLLEIGVLNDDRNGELFDNGTKYWFQLSDQEREAIVKKEKNLSKAIEKQHQNISIDTVEEPVVKYDREEELRQMKKKQAMDKCRNNKEALRRKAKAKGFEKIFDAHWIAWVKETKSDPSKFETFEQAVQHLL